MNKWWLAGLSLPAVAGLLWMAIASAGGAKAPARALAPQASLELAVSPPDPGPRAPEAPRIAAPSAPRLAALPTIPEPAPAGSAVDPASESDPAQMQALQALLDRDPEAALAAAREGLSRYPRSPDAAERTWVVVKALTVMGRSVEARREAEAMMPRFRGTRWASDVERHVLAHP